MATFLGLQGACPSPSNARTLRVTLGTPPEGVQWADSIPCYLRGRSLSHLGLEALIGRLNLAHPTTINRFARGMRKPLYLMLYPHHYSAAQCPLIALTLSRRYAAIISRAPRVVSGRRISADYISIGCHLLGIPLKSGMAGVLWRAFGGGESHPPLLWAPIAQWLLFIPWTPHRAISLAFVIRSSFDVVNFLPS